MVYRLPAFIKDRDLPSYRHCYIYSHRNHTAENNVVSSKCQLTPQHHGKRNDPKLIFSAPWRAHAWELCALQLYCAYQSQAPRTGLFSVFILACNTTSANPEGNASTQSSQQCVHLGFTIFHDSHSTSANDSLNSCSHMEKHYDERDREPQNGLLHIMERVFTNRKSQSKLFNFALISNTWPVFPNYWWRVKRKVLTNTIIRF